MTKRFTTDNGSNEDVCLVDNLTKKEYESNFNDIVDLMNQIWEQTQRFEKHNQYLEKENEQLKEKIEFIFEQIKAFREDCRTYQDFDGASTITQLIKILDGVKE